MCTSDAARGFRHLPGTTLALAVSRSCVWQPDVHYDVPDGYRHATCAQVQAQVQVLQQASGPGRHWQDALVYRNQAGWDGCQWEGYKRLAFVCADTWPDGAWIHAGEPLSAFGSRRLPRHSVATRALPFADHTFAGLVCIES